MSITTKVWVAIIKTISADIAPNMAVCSESSGSLANLLSCMWQSDVFSAACRDS